MILCAGKEFDGHFCAKLLSDLVQKMFRIWPRDIFQWGKKEICSSGKTERGTAKVVNSLSLARSVPSNQPSYLGTITPTKFNEFSENFRMGGGGHFRSEKFRCGFSGNFGAVKTMNFRKKGGGSRQSEWISLQIFGPPKKSANWLLYLFSLSSTIKM